MKKLALAFLLATIALSAGQGLNAAEVKTALDFRVALENKFLKVHEATPEGVPKQVEVDKQKYLTVQYQPEKKSPDDRVLYFDVSDDFAKALGKDCYVVVEYHDNSYGWFGLNYDAEKNAYACAASAGNVMLSTNKDRQALFVLHDIKFKNEENGGTDFRLVIKGDILLKGITVSTAAANADQYLATVAPKIEERLGIGKDFEVCFGGYDISKAEDTPGIVAALTQVLPVWRQLGVTSHEGYVRWGLIEREKGKYDFSAYDPIVQLYQKFGMKWVPFIILGPPYSLPNWYYKSNERVDSVCLEHNQKSDVQSIWNLNLAKYVDGFMRAFADHYKKSGVIESVILGISGNYGESIYCATGNQDWTNETHGEYHTHGGYWCGDEFAVKDYRQWLKKRFETDIQKLNARWKTQFANFDAVKPDANSQGMQFLDFVEWYRGSMTNWVEFWCKTTRKYFPTEDVYMVTGGHMPPEHGLDISAQAKICAKYRIGIRITNEATAYSINFPYTRLVASSCRFYGTYFGYEPAGMVDVSGIACRNFNDTSSGARHVHFYANLPTSEPARVEAWAKSAKFLQKRDPILECAVIYPFTAFTIAKTGVNTSKILTIRDITDVAWIDERMVRDGALDKFKVVCLIEGNVYPADVLDKIIEYVKNGGTLILSTTGDVNALEGGDDLRKRADALREGEAAKVGNDWECVKIGKGRALFFKGVAGFENTAVAKVLFGKDKIDGFEPLKTIEADIEASVADRVFFTYFKDSALVLNFSNAEMTKKFQVNGNVTTVKIPPYSIIEVSLKSPPKP
jgi:hypothetical protein